MLALFAWYVFSIFFGMQTSVLGVPVIAVGFVMAAAAYLYGAFKKKALLPALKVHVPLTLLVAQGILWVLLSYLGLKNWLPGAAHVAFEGGYIPRHAYYLALLPLIAFAPYLSDGEGIFRFLRQYSLLVPVAFFAVKSCVCFGFVVTPTTMILLAFCSLIADGTYKYFKAANWIAFALFLIIPGDTFGNSTVLLIKAVYAALFLGKALLKNRQWILYLLTALVPAILLVSFLLPQLPGLYQKIDDRNTLWRVSCWAAEEQTIAATYGIGTGYGTAYIGDDSPLVNSAEFLADDTYSAEERIFVTGPHNSFVAVTYRMGVLGLALFVWFLLLVWRGILRHKTGEQFTLAFLFCSSILLISTNNGLESPVYFVVFLTAFYLISARLGRPQSPAPEKEAAEG